MSILSVCPSSVYLAVPYSTTFGPQRSAGFASFRFSQVDRQELAEIMRGLGDKLNDSEIDLLINAADKNNDGTISMQE